MEKAVQDARHGLWYDTPPFKSLNELNQWLQERCQALWQKNSHPQLKARSLAQCLEDERPRLMPVPVAFDGFIEHSKRVYPQRLAIVAEAADINISKRCFVQSTI